MPKQPDQTLYFLEVQYQRDESFYWRFITEIFVYMHQYHPQQPWLGVVLFSSRGVDLGLPRVYEMLRAQLQILYLDEMEFAGESALEQQLLALVVEDGERARERIEGLRVRLQGMGDVSQRSRILELVEKIVAYKFRDWSREEIEAMFTMEELKQTRYVQELMAEKLNEGRQEGRQEGELAIVLKQLTRKLGSLPPEIQSRIQSLSVSELEALGKALLDFSSLEDLAAWLNP